MLTRKTVEGYFGPKQLTREEYTKRWTDHARELFSLSNTANDHNEIQTMIARVSVLAGASWDRIPS